MSYPPPPSQPAYSGGGQAVTPPNNNMPISIASLVAGVLCTCLGGVPGIIAVVNAGKVGNLAAQGDQAGAEQAAANARKWAIIGFVVTAILFVLLVGLQVLVIGATDDNNTTY